MTEIEAPPDGTRGAGGIIEKQITYKIQYLVHVPLYKLTGGIIGHRIGKLTTLLLTTTGAKSGLPRTLGLNYRRDGDNFVIVASKGGVPTNPNWYHNLKAHPEVTVEIGGEKFKARAHEAGDDDYERLYQNHASKTPAFNEYRLKTTRHIPVMVLERLNK